MADNQAAGYVVQSSNGRFLSRGMKWVRKRKRSQTQGIERAWVHSAKTLRQLGDWHHFNDKFHPARYDPTRETTEILGSPMLFETLSRRHGFGGELDRRIVIVDGDAVQVKSLKMFLQGAFRKVMDIAIEIIDSEADFRTRLLLDLADRPPILVISEVMISWQHFGQRPVVTKPPDVEKDNYYTAGTRCWQLLQKELPAVPLVFFACLELSDLKLFLPELPHNVRFVAKQDGYIALFWEAETLLGTAQ